MGIFRSVFPPVYAGGRANLLPWEETIDLMRASTGPVLDLSAGGTFTRSTEGSYLTSAPTDGTVGFNTWAIANARRLEDLGDGLGPMLKMEDARTNRCLFSRQMNGANWSAGNATMTQDAANGIDGTLVADQANALSTKISNFVLQQGLTTQQCGSVWRRAVSGTVNHQITLGNGAGLTPVVAKASAATTTYSRIFVVGTSFPQSAGMIPLDSEDQSGIGGQTAQAQNCYLDCNQLEVGGFPSSAIRTPAGATVTRGADRLTFTSGNYPASFNTTGFVFTFAPAFSNADLATDNNIQIIVGNLGGTSIVRFNVNGTISFYANGFVGNTGVLTWSANQLLTFRVEPLAGKLTVTGQTSGSGTVAGTGAAWTAGATLEVGAYSGANGVFGRFGLTMTGL